MLPSLGSETILREGGLGAWGEVMVCIVNNDDSFPFPYSLTAMILV
jgi:hypothetical protein